jgi:hypothetical protein
MVACRVRVVRINETSQPHGFFDFPAVPLVLPDQQIGDSARVAEIILYYPCRDDG